MPRLDRSFDDDPLATVTAPPKNESHEEQTIRETREAEALKVSEAIDDELRKARIQMKKQKGVVRVLLLGQSESGKSTTVKNFRMKYARTAWKQERLSWRAVIQLNIIRSILAIIANVRAEMEHRPWGESLDPEQSAPESFEEADYIPLTESHEVLMQRLRPIQSVEVDLMRRLGAESEIEHASYPPRDVLGMPVPSKQRKNEFGVRRWQDALFRAQSPLKKSAHKAVVEDPLHDEATGVLANCGKDMQWLWTDETVQAVLRKRNVTLENSAGFFLNDLDRIATTTYEPTDDDILRARLRTLAVQEHKITIEPGSEADSTSNGRPMTSTSSLSDAGDKSFGRDWIIYDVGGSRTIRHAWLPFFDNVNAIIFLARELSTVHQGKANTDYSQLQAISCFDERLAEDPTVNRLEDSLLLWTHVCASRLLLKTTLILFLNKCDLLKRKLKSGVKVVTYLPSYGDRPNEAAPVVKYLRDKFKAILRQNSIGSRPSYYYPTSVTDPRATALTLNTVRDSILRESLKSCEII